MIGLQKRGPESVAKGSQIVERMSAGEPAREIGRSVRGKKVYF